jgi:hypothetical protein
MTVTYLPSSTYTFALDHPEGIMYMVLDKNFSKSAPVLPNLYPYWTASFEAARTSTTLKSIHTAVLIDSSKRLFLPFKDNLPQPITESGLQGYIPVGYGYTATAFKLYNYEIWGDHSSDTQRPALVGWLKYYNDNGEGRFGWSTYFRRAETGPIWKACDPEKLDQLLQRNFLFIGYQEKLDKTIFIAQGLDDKFRIYELFYKEPPILLVDKAFESLASARKGFNWYRDNEYYKGLAKTAEKKKKAQQAREALIAQWQIEFNTALPVSDVNNRRTRELAYLLGAKAMYAYCMKFRESAGRSMVSDTYWALRNSDLNYNHQRDIKQIGDKIYFDARQAEADRQADLSYQAAQERKKYNNMAGNSSSLNSPKPMLRLDELNQRWESYHRNGRRNGYRQSFDQWSKRFGN